MIPPAISRIKPSTPPTTPPTIAPVGEVFSVANAVVVVDDVGLVDVPDVLEGVDTGVDVGAPEDVELP